MGIKELIALLLDKQKGQGAEMRVLLGSAAGTIENLLGQVDTLKAELRDERHRHDRYVDFELAEAEELRKLKEQLRWIPVSERLPEETETEWEGEKHTSSDIVQVAVMDSLGKRFVTDDMLYDGKWVNYPWGDFDITHWRPLPEPPKGE